eukprot:jgi/Galph1/5723/GphlegSOOS_G4391.1
MRLRQRHEPSSIQRQKRQRIEQNNTRKPKKVSTANKSTVSVAKENLEDGYLIENTRNYLLRKLSEAKLSSYFEEFSKLRDQIVSILTDPSPGDASLLLIGPVGSGKCSIIEESLAKVKLEALEHRYKIIRLVGALHAEGEGAMKEIHLQMNGNKQKKENNEMDNCDNLPLFNSNGKDSHLRYVFILYGFEYFLKERSQHFVYRLFDALQRNEFHGVVIATSQRYDVVDSLEKRVKSRFSHRIYYMPCFKNSKSLINYVELLLKVDSDAPDCVFVFIIEILGNANSNGMNTLWCLSKMRHWLRYLKDFSVIKLRYLLSEAYQMLSLTSHEIITKGLEALRHATTLLNYRAHRVNILKNLSVLELALLAALCRLTLRSCQNRESEVLTVKSSSFSFECIYREYTGEGWSLNDSANFSTDSYKRPIAWKAFMR